MKEHQKPAFIHVMIGMVIAAAVIMIEWHRAYPVFHLLCDGFFVAAVILLGIGGIMAARNAGSFDVIGYGVKHVIGIAIPGARLADSHDQETLLEYKERKAEKRNSPAPMLIAGGIHLLLALVMLIIYMLTS